MGFLTLPKKFHPDFRQLGVKPTGPAVIDEDNWAAKRRIFYCPLLDLQGDFIEGNCRDMGLSTALGTPVVQKGLTAVGGTTYSFNGNILSLNSSANDTNFDTPSGVQDLSGDIDYTYFIKLKTGLHVSQGSSLNTFFSYGDTNSVSLAINSSEQLWVFVDTASVVFTSVDMTQVHTIAVSIDNSANLVTVYVDGVAQSSTITISSPITKSSTYRLTLGGSGGTPTNRDCACEVEYFGVLRDSVTPAQALSLHTDPYQLLRPATPLPYFIPSVAAVTAALTGTGVPTQTEADIVTGGKTIIITLTGDTFVTGTSSEDGIAGGSDSDKTGANKWDALIKTDLDNTNVALSVGDTVATITLPAYASYDTDETETITWTIPSASLTTSTSDIIVTPTHTVTAVVSGRVMGSLANNGGLAGVGGLAGRGGGLAG